MKNVLFATTALVAFAGAASAQEISWGGEVTTGYNFEIEGGLFLKGELTASATVDLGDNVTAEFAWAGASWNNNALTLSDKITATITYTNNNMTASLKAGDLGDKGASEYFYNDRDGMDIDVENQDGDSDVRALVEFGSFGVAVGCSAVGGVIGTCDGMNVGAGATFGSIELGIGYDDAAGSQSSVTAVSADATFGSMSVGVSYATGTVTKTLTYDSADGDPLLFDDVLISDVYSETSIGVSIDYDISDSMSVNAYYASNTIAPDSYGVSASFSTGAFGIDAYYDVTGTHVFADNGTGVDGDLDGSTTNGGQDHDNTVTTAYGLDLSYAMSDSLNAFAGVKVSSTASPSAALVSPSATTYYVGVDYAVNDNITATLSYATANEISGPEYKEGITALITASF